MIRRKSSSRVSIYVRNVGKISYLWKDRGINVSKPLPRATIETKNEINNTKRLKTTPIIIVVGLCSACFGVVKDD